MAMNIADVDAETIPPVRTPRTYFPELDGVRALAIGMVMLVHFKTVGIIPIPNLKLLGPDGIDVLLQSGVDLFFALSGFLITGILLKAPQGDWHEVKTFYIRRSLRIFPLYYAVLIALTLIGHPSHYSFWIYLQNIWLTINPKTAGLVHFWSLAVEEQFYLVWPFIVLFTPRRYIVPILVSMVMLALAFRASMLHLGVDPYFLTPARIDSLAAGALVALGLANGRLHAWRPAMAWLTGLSIPCILMEANLISYHPWSRNFVQTTRFSLYAVLYASFLGLLITDASGLMRKVCAASWLRYIGRISYGLYIYHYIVFITVEKYFATRPVYLKVAASLIATAALTLTSWHLLERPFIAQKQRWAPERSAFAAGKA